MRIVQLNGEKDVTLSLPFAVSFAKSLGPDYFGILPRSARAGPDATVAQAAAAPLGLIGVPVIRQDHQEGFLRLFRNYFAAAAARLVEEHTVTLPLAAACRKHAVLTHEWTTVTARGAALPPGRAQAGT